MGNKALDLSAFIATHKDPEKRIDLYKSEVFYEWHWNWCAVPILVSQVRQFEDCGSILEITNKENILVLEIF